MAVPTTGATPTTHSPGWEHAATLPRNTTLYTILRHVSRSGMARDIDVVWFENNEPRWLRIDEIHGASRSFEQDNRQHGATYRRHGAGMDMGFDLVYAIGRMVHDDGYYFAHRWL
jgi:hypothetical protein